MKKFMRKNRYTLILLLVFLLLVFLGFMAKDILIPDENKAAYGKRLEGIEEHQIGDGVYETMQAELEKNEKVKSVTHRLQGKVVYFIITVSDDVSIKDAKSIGSQILNYYTEGYLSYYSFQIFIKKDDATLNNFPISGMKNPGSNSINWSNDRDITVSEEKTNEE